MHSVQMANALASSALLMDRIEHLAPSSDGGDDLVEIGGPCKELRLFVVLFEQTTNRSLRIGDRSENAAFQSSLALRGITGITALRGITGTPLWTAPLK